MGSVFGREATRLPFRLAVTVTIGDAQLSLFTQDVSFGGLFLRTDEPVRLRRVVRVRADLPFELGPITLDAVVVHVHAGEAPDAAPGIGLQIFNSDPRAVDRWVRFVHSVRERSAGTSREFLESIGSGKPEPIRRKHPRLAALLDVRLESGHELTRLQAVDVSRRGLFVRTDLRLAPGDHVFLRLHPRDNPESYGVGAVVRHASERGVGLELVDWASGGFETFEQLVEEARETREIEGADIVGDDDDPAA